MSASEVESNLLERKPVTKRRPRSAITSGRQLFVQGDSNSAWARRYHDLRGHYISDISAGRGRDALTEAQAALIDRVVSIQCELERMDAMMSRGELVDLTEYGRATSHFRRVLETLGVERKPRDVALDLHSEVLPAMATKHDEDVHDLVD